MTYLTVEGISKRFAQSGAGRNGTSYTEALDGISFGVERGEFVCIIGPSGCGKSTLLRIIDGLIAADAGQVRLDGQAISGPGSNRGMVFQHFNLLPWRTALGNIEFGLEAQRMGRRERRERAERYLERVGLTGFARHYPAQLSGGMQQRVGLARALAIEPELLLMDEPFGALDAMTRQLMQTELSRILALETRTALFVTHDIEEAIFLSDKILVMSARPGKIAEIVPITFPRPRDDSLRSTPAFAKLRGDLWQLLKMTIQENAVQ